MGFGGFSWKRALGVSKAKADISRKIGIPLTKGGRQRKLGKAMGGCCVVFIIALFGFLFVASTIYAATQADNESIGEFKEDTAP